jgi:uncharacterized membrane protein YiaA
MINKNKREIKMKETIFIISFILFIGLILFLINIFSKNNNIEINEDYIDYLIITDFFNNEDNKNDEDI